MDKNKHIDQDEVNEVWRKEWQNYLGSNINPHKIFLQRLFVEGYPIFKKYIPDNVIEVLDVGSGTGRYGIRVAQDYPESKVIISDILEESLNIGRAISGKLALDNVHFLKDDILSSSLSDNKFDVIICDVVIQHLPDYVRAIREMKRLAKPGGRILISAVNTWNFHDVYKKFLTMVGRPYEYGYERSFSSKELSEIIQGEGLKVVAVDGFYVGYGIYRLKKYCKIFSLLGKIVNRMAKILDGVTGRYFSRNFGFEIVVVGEKKR